MALEKQEIEWWTGAIAGQEAALVLLVKVLHSKGVLDGGVYTNALKDTFNDPAAQFTRDEYQYVQALAKYLDEEFAAMPPFMSGDFRYERNTGR